MSFSNDPNPWWFTQRLSDPEPQTLADPPVDQHDHRSELPEGKPRNRLGDAATLAALLGVVLVWALQDSFYVIGFIISGLACVAGAIALFMPGRRRAFAVTAVLIGALPFLFTIARLAFHF
jgi:hypothetical protein